MHIRELYNTVFPLISALAIIKFRSFWDAALIEAWLLKEGGAYLKVRAIIHVNFQNYLILSF